MGCSGCGIFGMRDFGDVGCWGCVMFGMWDVRIWDVWNVGCSGYGISGMWDYQDLGCGMWDVCRDVRC